MNEAPRLLLSIPNTLSTRNLLRTDVLAILRAEAARVTLVAPFAEDREFRDEFVGDTVAATRMAPYVPRRMETVLRHALYALYLGGSPPRTLRIFLEAWSEAHPWIGPLRQRLNRALARGAAPMAPVLERLYLRHGDIGPYAELLRRDAPDLAVFTRLFFCEEIPLIRAASRAGIPTLGVVASWDNLTSKGPLLPRVDRLVVWNDRMADEAVRYHGYRPEDVAVTGAPHHDLAFAGRERFASRAEFFARLALDPRKRLIVYAGEDPCVAPEAPRYVEILHRLITQGGLSFPAQILVRPHPQDDPRRFDAIRRLPGVVFDLPGRPSERYWMDMTREHLRHLYETMSHADVVVNVCSTIVLDAALFDTPSICIAFTERPHPVVHSARRLFELDHFRAVVDTGGTTLVLSEQGFREALEQAIADPAACAAGRRRLVRDLAQFDDGKSGWRTAREIIAAAVSARSRAGRAARGGAR